MDLKRGDLVRYRGPSPHRRGVPDASLAGVAPGDEGKVVDVAGDGYVVVAWRDALTLVHPPPSNTWFERLPGSGPS